MSTDFSFVDKIYSGGLAAKADKFGLYVLSIPERSVMLAWWAKGVVGNGGFALLYSTDTDIDDVCKAFEEIGIDEAVAACEGSKTVFLGGAPPKDKMKRFKFMERILDRDDDDLDPWLEWDRIIWRLDDDFDSAVAQYVRRNMKKFEKYMHK